jgi:hypothetical protein
MLTNLMYSNKSPTRYNKAASVVYSLACFAGSNPAEGVRLLGRKNPQHAFLCRGVKRRSHVVALWHVKYFEM